MRMTTKLVAALALLVALAGAVKAEVITLRDGRVLHVKVLSGDDRGVEVQRLDNHGKLFIRWPLLLGICLIVQKFDIESKFRRRSTYVLSYRKPVVPKTRHSSASQVLNKERRRKKVVKRARKS